MIEGLFLVLKILELHFKIPSMYHKKNMTILLAHNITSMQLKMHKMTESRLAVA